MFDKFRLKEVLVEYKKRFVQQQWPNEKYKWEAVQCFQLNWDVNSDDFAQMLTKSLAQTANLLASVNNFPARMITKFAEIAPEEVRSMYIELYDESKDLYERVASFKNLLPLIRFLISAIPALVFPKHYLFPSVHFAVSPVAVQTAHPKPKVWPHILSSSTFINLVIFKKHGMVYGDTPFFAAVTEGISAEVANSGYNLQISYFYGNQDNAEHAAGLRRKAAFGECRSMPCLRRLRPGT